MDLFPLGHVLRVRCVDGHAQVHIGDRVIEVDRRDNALRTKTCPVELVTAALGS